MRCILPEDNGKTLTVPNQSVKDQSTHENEERGERTSEDTIKSLFLLSQNELSGFTFMCFVFDVAIYEMYTRAPKVINKQSKTSRKMIELCLC